jgi:hypothetical protein
VVPAGCNDDRFPISTNHQRTAVLWHDGIADFEHCSSSVSGGAAARPDGRVSGRQCDARPGLDLRTSHARTGFAVIGIRFTETPPPEANGRSRPVREVFSEFPARADSTPPFPALLRRIFVATRGNTGIPPAPPHKA